MEDTRILSYVPLSSPADVKLRIPRTKEAAKFVQESRAAVVRILNGEDADHKLCIVGPCSVHDPAAVLEYCEMLTKAVSVWGTHLRVLVRLYFQKPRTTGGWTGYLDDPGLNATFDARQGILECRALMRDVTNLGLGICTEFVGTTVEPQYLSDFVTVACIGARTTESQVHRQLASGLSCPVGFKNGSDGSTKVCLDAMEFCSKPQGFVGVDPSGTPAAVKTSGNSDTFVILRGSYKNGSNIHKAGELCKEGHAVVVDCAHGNSGKTLAGQARAFREAMGYLDCIKGIMLESFLVEGTQKVAAVRGMSITDPCLGMRDTLILLEEFENAAAGRILRKKLK